MSGPRDGHCDVMAPTIGRIHKRASFRALARPDGRATAGPLRVAYVQGSAETPGLACVGYAVGRRHGNAVARNRLRRRLRAALHEVDAAAALPPGAYLVSARPDAAGLDANALRAALEAATTGASRRGQTARAARRDGAAGERARTTAPGSAAAAPTCKETATDTMIPTDAGARR